MAQNGTRHRRGESEDSCVNEKPRVEDLTARLECAQDDKDFTQAVVHAIVHGLVQPAESQALLKASAVHARHTSNKIRESIAAFNRDASVPICNR